jgi:chromate reductase
MKNFLDWSSRPENEPLPWAGKPVGIFGASNGARGASFAQYHVRSVMSYFNARPMGQPEFYLGNDDQKFDADLNLTDAKTIEVLKKFLAAFSEHIQK